MIVTGSGPDVEAAIESVKLGAFHFASKTSGPDSVRQLVVRALKRRALTRQMEVLSAEAAETTDREFIVGPSPALQDVMNVVKRIAPLSATVLILGESGTGKVCWRAKLIVAAGTPEGPFVAVNLAAIPAEPG